MEFKGKKITVLGFGRSGYAVSKRLNSLGANVLLSEKKERDAFEKAKIAELESSGVRMEFGGHTSSSLNGTDLLVVSPGVHPDIEIVDEAKKKSIEIISELELAHSLISKPIIAVTGTNGKTTTATLIGEMLVAGGKRAAVAGNIGHPISLVDDSGLDYVVAEVSSYQLEAIKNFRPRISIILNITEDHLERHKTMEEYARLKARIFANQKQEDFHVYNLDDPIVAGLSASAKSKLIPFSRKEEPENGFYLRGSNLMFSVNGEKSTIINAEKIFIKGEHNIENVLAASAAAFLSGVDVRTISGVIENFKGVPHRIEYVASVSEVSFYNDSKGTNANSTIVALRALNDRIILIAGGCDKGGDLTNLVGEAKKRVKAVVLIGEAKRRFRENFSKLGYSSIHEADTMEDAVEKAFNLGGSGDKVLLSPACASFDMFLDYEQRGAVFKSVVHSLAKRVGK